VRVRGGGERIAMAHVDAEHTLAQAPKSRPDEQGKADAPRRAVAEPPDIASAAKLLILVAAIYCYFAGWVYAYHLFSHFGLSFSAVDIPAYYFFVYAYFVFPHASLTSILVGIGVAAVVCLLSGGYREVSSLSTASTGRGIKELNRR